MPFGLIFGAIASLVLCLWLAWQYVFPAFEPPAAVRLPLRLAGVALAVLGVSLSLGLLRRQALARWTGVVAAAFFTLLGLANAVAFGRVIDHVMWLVALFTFLLLLIPTTGNVRRGLPIAEEGVPPRPRGRAMGITALTALVALVGLYGWTWTRFQSLSGAGVQRVSRGPQVQWLEWGPGFDKARAEGKPVFVDFYADWCAPCRAMDRDTFRDERVVERLSELITIKVDSEDTRPRHGFTGEELAEKYGVIGYPTLAILDPKGRVISRRSGFVSARQLLSWLDEHIMPGLKLVEDEQQPPIAL